MMQSGGRALKKPRIAKDRECETAELD